MTKTKEKIKFLKLKCSSCGKEDETVSVRNCGYDADVNNDPNSLETVCDDCEEQHCLDI